MYYQINNNQLAVKEKSLLNRLYTYTNERFPLAQYGVITALFALSGLSLSSALSTGHAHFTLAQYAVAAITTFILFYQLRVADEFKDHIDDCRYAPERPVPRGLVSLRELGSSALLLGLIQFALASTLKPALWPYLFAIWIYFALMSKEFFIGPWLRKHPILYMLSHMFILVFSDLFITAVDFVGSNQGFAPLLLFFLTGSFFNGMVIEFGRKIKAPECEREGIESYSRALGLEPAVVALTASTIAAQACLILALPHNSNLAALVFTAVDCCAFTVFHKFMSKPELGSQKRLEATSGLLVAVSYLTVSLISWM
ncbi:UbiA family prenyltransferase [soil metagenome]